MKAGNGGTDRLNNHSIIRLFDYSIIRKARQGFTLIEMLVVIGIIAILMGVLLASMSGSVEKARMVKCASNIHNLAFATLNYAYGYGSCMPCAQPIAHLTSDPNGGAAYDPAGSWLSNLDQGMKWPSSSPTMAPTCSFAADQERDRIHALTNGVIWHSLGGNRTTYVCPAFAEACANKGVLHPAFSYQMNAYFGYMVYPGYFKAGTPYVSIQRVKRPERLLLFAEIPGCLSARGTGNVQGGDGSAGGNGVAPLPPENLTGGNGTPECDGCLHSMAHDGTESIGFNHRRGKKIIGHVAFCDGHVEMVEAPMNGQYRELTGWLCSGLDIVMDSRGNYKSAHDQLEEDLKAENEERNR